MGTYFLNVRCVFKMKRLETRTKEKNRADCIISLSSLLFLASCSARKLKESLPLDHFSLKTSKCSQITLCILTNVLTSISERFCPNFEQINNPPHRIGQSSIYVQNLNVNTQIVQGPLQALLSHTRPLAIRKQICE